MTVKSFSDKHFTEQTLPPEIMPTLQAGILVCCLGMLEIYTPKYIVILQEKGIRVGWKAGGGEWVCVLDMLWRNNIQHL